MSCRVRSLAAFTGMIVAMSLLAALMVQAQTPAGPNRPAQVPEEYIVTPFGYFHPSCVVQLAKGEELLEHGQAIQKADGTISTVPVCEYPHYTARGEMFPAGSMINPPTISHSWIISQSTSTTSYGEIVADWNVPSAPQSYDGQTVYFFPGLEQYVNDVSILQPVLGWNADFRQAWGIASWNCCPVGTADESSPVRVNTGDLIVGTVKSTCGSGTLSCPTWKITTQDQSTGGNTTLNNTPSEGQTFNWAFGGVLEAYSVVRCSDYPPNNYLTFTPTLYDYNFNIIENPSWELDDWASGLTPQCNYGGQVSSSEVTLAFGSFILTVSPTGYGFVISTDGYINCTSTCTQNYQADTPVTLNAFGVGGWGFAGWGGACTGMGSCSVTMTQNQSVTATFAPYYTLTVAPIGHGSVTSTDGNINCPGRCSYSYLSNTPVTLNASPARGWSFSGWTGACNGISCNVNMTQNLDVTPVFVQTGSGLQFTPVAPCRLLDTRPDYGGSGPLQAGTSTNFVISQLGGCNIPTTAAAYSLNVTVVPQGPLAYLTIWPNGEARPITSTLNSDGRIKANAAIVSPGAQDAVRVHVTNTTDLVLDINGYFEPATGSTLAYYPLPPCRVADTRQPNGPLGGPHLPSKQERDFPILDASACNIPSTAQAYSLNFTLVPRSDSVGVFTAWSYGQPKPVSSTLNAPTGTVVANAAIVSAGPGGEIATLASNDADLVIDINGYFAPAGAGGLSLYPVAPCRAIDTRQGNGAFSWVLSPPVNVAGGLCAPPSTAQAYVFNATVVPTGSLAHLNLWPDTEAQPLASTLNADDGAITSNMAIVGNIDGKTDAYALGTTQLILDIASYFAP